MAVASEETAEVVRARHQGTMFNEMGMANLVISAKLILADLKLLSGLKLPTGDGFGRLSELLAESLKEDYPYYTVPLVQMAIKKHVNVLTTGKEKSYGRDISIADIHQVMDAFLSEVQAADNEVDLLMNKSFEEKQLTENEKQNLIRKGIQEQLESGDFRCTYVEFNQLVKDGLILDDCAGLYKHAWPAIKKLKNKYQALVQAEKMKTGKTKSDPENISQVLRVNEATGKLQQLIELEQEIMGEVASMYLEWVKKAGYKKIYENV